MRTPPIAWLVPVLALGLLAGCGDSVKEKAAPTTTTTTTASGGPDLGEACVKKVLNFLNNDLDLDRFAANDPTYEPEIVAALGECQIEDLTDLQLQAVQVQLDADVASVLGADSTGSTDQSTTSSSTP
jgi:hypothetical protein